jgi:hypothetical protein
MRLTTLRSRLGFIGGKDHERVRAVSEERTRSMLSLYDLLEEILAEANRRVREWDGQLIFVYLPAKQRYDGGSEGPNPDRDPILQRAAAVGLPMVDVHQAFMAQPDPMALFPLRLAEHYNDAGHALVGDTILSYLSQ